MPLLDAAPTLKTVAEVSSPSRKTLAEHFGVKSTLTKLVPAENDAPFLREALMRPWAAFHTARHKPAQSDNFRQKVTSSVSLLRRHQAKRPVFAGDFNMAWNVSVSGPTGHPF
ncbi:hypothetical protein [Candidatus Accumulibacter aalborgensis]|uniref:hypothetical protein n=1 Tax=Candidatus Accumulibacter aalborgensis TaxID=1860102 RepID=UPI0016460312|nr:hypothetical protein [Candidatus Accumulibacter aalborgensis]